MKRNNTTNKISTVTYAFVLNGGRGNGKLTAKSCMIFRKTQLSKWIRKCQQKGIYFIRKIDLF